VNVGPACRRDTGRRRCARNRHGKSFTPRAAPAAVIRRPAITRVPCWRARRSARPESRHGREQPGARDERRGPRCSALTSRANATSPSGRREAPGAAPEAGAQLVARVRARSATARGEYFLHMSAIRSTFDPRRRARHRESSGKLDTRSRVRKPIDPVHQQRNAFHARHQAYSE